MNAFIRRFSVITGFSLLVVLLIGSAFITKRQLNVQLGNEIWAVHSREVRFELAQLELLLEDAETGQRGYLYTGESKYLAPYNMARTQLDSHLQHLAQLTSDNPLQQQHVAAVRDLAGKKLDELAETIALFQSGKTSEAKTIVLSDRGLLIMNDLRQEISLMQKDEASLEALRVASYDRSIRLTLR